MSRDAGKYEKSTFSSEREWASLNVKFEPPTATVKVLKD